MRLQRSINRVLVVDDDEKVLSACRRVRSRRVFTADNPTTALELARTEQPELAVVDLRLGTESGIDVTRELKEVCPDLIVALCSGYLSVTTAVAAVKAGADVVVFKPVTFEEIMKRVEGKAEPPAPLDETPTLARAEWEHISRVLADCNGNVSLAARRLGIYRSSLQRRLRKYAPQQ